LNNGVKQVIEAKSFYDVVRDRRSIRSFLSTPVSDELVQAVIDDARHAPSNANIQPWEVHIVSGARRDALSAAMLAAEVAGKFSPDFPFSYDEFYGAYSERQKAQAAAYYQALGVAREAFDERHSTMLRNLEFFGAPHVCLLFMPAFCGGVRIAGDIGMYGQTFLLSLAAHGLGGVPQTLLGFFADEARDILGIDSSMKMLFGISFGHPDMSSLAAQYRIGKAPAEENVIFHS
jgi:nitroreductase